jgi:hypothetical protein
MKIGYWGWGLITCVVLVIVVALASHDEGISQINREKLWLSSLSPVKISKMPW